MVLRVVLNSYKSSRLDVPNFREGGAQNGLLCSYVRSEIIFDALGFEIIFSKVLNIIRKCLSKLTFRIYGISVYFKSQVRIPRWLVNTIDTCGFLEYTYAYF